MNNVSIVSDGNPRTTTIRVGSTPMDCVKSIDLHINANESRCTMQLECTAINYSGDASVQMIHPISGEWITIKRIEYVDGTTFDAS